MRYKCFILTASILSKNRKTKGEDNSLKLKEEKHDNGNVVDITTGEDYYNVGKSTHCINWLQITFFFLLKQALPFQSQLEEYRLSYICRFLFAVAKDVLAATIQENFCWDNSSCERS